ncbi:hypothetical protein [Burkholderia gladioli]|nr:hypothetical protein [Burkholderia gladioli]
MTYDFYVGWKDWHAGMPFAHDESDQWKAGWSAARDGKSCGSPC